MYSRKTAHSWRVSAMFGPCNWFTWSSWSQKISHEIALDHFSSCLIFPDISRHTPNCLGFLKWGYPKSSIFFAMSIVNHPAIGLPPFSDPWSYRTPFSPWWGTSWTALDAGLIVHYVGHVVFFAGSSHSFSKACYGMTRDNKKCSADLWWLKLCSKGDQVKIKMINLNLPKQTIWAAFTIQGRFCNRKKELINRRIFLSYDVHVGKSLVAFHYFSEDAFRSIQIMYINICILYIYYGD